MMDSTLTPSPAPRSRLFALFGDVRTGEARGVLLLLANLFLLLVGYYVLKTVREPLILATGGAEIKSYAAAGQALALMGFIPLYGWFSSRVGRASLNAGVCLFFAANIEAFYLGARLGVPHLGFVFYIWVGIFSLATIAQFWSYANDIYPKDVGERLFPIIAIGAAVGSPVGAKAAELLFRAGVAPYSMLHITAAILLVQLALYRISERQVPPSRRVAGASGLLTGAGGFRLALATPYLRLIVLLLVLLNTVNTTGEYLLGRSVVTAAEAAVASGLSLSKAAFIGGFYGSYFFWVNLASVAIQSLLVSRVVRRFGIAGVLLALPMVALGVYVTLAAGVGLAILRWGKTLENATDYSIMNTGRQLMWLPTTREEKYKAKQAADTFFVRVGDVLSALLVLAGSRWLDFGTTGFALTNAALVVAWLYIVTRLLREHRALTKRESAS